jgi:hypothetical protein
VTHVEKGSFYSGEVFSEYQLRTWAYFNHNHGRLRRTSCVPFMLIFILKTNNPLVLPWWCHVLMTKRSRFRKGNKKSLKSVRLEKIQPLGIV